MRFDGEEQDVLSAPTTELPEVKTVDVGQYNTINLQMALAESMKEVLDDGEDAPGGAQVPKDMSEEEEQGYRDIDEEGYADEPGEPLGETGESVSGDSREIRETADADENAAESRRRVRRRKSGRKPLSRTQSLRRFWRRRRSCPT